MINPQETRTSRRSALKGLGVVGGVAVGLASGWESVGAAPGPAVGVARTDNEPVAVQTRDAAPLLTATHGLTYLTFGQFAFRPNLFANGYSVSGTGCYCSTTDGYVVANLDLPAGAIVKQIDFAGQNNSGGAVSFFVERFELAGSGNNTVGEVLIPNGAAVLQSGTVAVNHVVDSAYSYDAALFTGSKMRMFSCRVGFAGPFGFFPVTPQVRKLDTREPGPLTGKFLPGQTRTLALGLPTGATAAIVNVTVTDTVGGGFLGLFPAGTPWPGTASINWAATGQSIGNNATVPVSPSGDVNIICNGSPDAATSVVIDLVGYLR